MTTITAAGHVHHASTDAAQYGRHLNHLSNLADELVEHLAASDGTIYTEAMCGLTFDYLVNAISATIPQVIGTPIHHHLSVALAQLSDLAGTFRPAGNLLGQGITLGVFDADTLTHAAEHLEHAARLDTRPAPHPIQAGL